MPYAKSSSSALVGRSGVPGWRANCRSGFTHKPGLRDKPGKPVEAGSSDVLRCLIELAAFAFVLTAHHDRWRGFPFTHNPVAVMVKTGKPGRRKNHAEHHDDRRADRKSTRLNSSH